MKEKGFVFLYPIKEYVDAIVGSDEERMPYRKDQLARLNEIIDTRYRQRGYQVYWVFFGSEEDPLSPDMSQKSEEILNDPSDIQFSCGVTFRDHVDNAKYPDTGKVLDMLNSETDELFVGGFHQWDCVSKVAEEAYKRGVRVMVDEDTTEIFLLGGSSSIDTPLIRDPSVIGTDSDLVIDLRPKEPWLATLVYEDGAHDHP